MIHSTAWRLPCMVSDARASRTGCLVWGPGFTMQGLGFRVWGLAGVHHLRRQAAVEVLCQAGAFRVLLEQSITGHFHFEGHHLQAPAALPLSWTGSKSGLVVKVTRGCRPIDLHQCLGTCCMGRGRQNMDGDHIRPGAG